VATKGYVVMRYTGPWEVGSDAHEKWGKAARSAFRDAMPAFKAAGGMSFKHWVDYFNRMPRSLFVFEFDTLEKALAWLISPANKTLLDEVLHAGAQDMDVSVSTLYEEG